MNLRIYIRFVSTPISSFRLWVMDCDFDFCTSAISKAKAGTRQVFQKYWLKKEMNEWEKDE